MSEQQGFINGNGIIRVPRLSGGSKGTEMGVEGQDAVNRAGGWGGCLG